MVLTGMRFEDNIDIYYIGDDNIVYHCYNGSPTGWNWVGPMAISSNNAKCGISCAQETIGNRCVLLGFLIKVEELL